MAVAKSAITLALLAVGVALAAEFPDRATAPAEVMPLADQSLLLDIVPFGAGAIAVGERGHVLLVEPDGSARQADAVPTRSTLTAITTADGQLWAVGHDSVILRSSDGGQTWKLVDSDPELEEPLLDVFFLDAEKGFALGAYGRLLRTDDGGDSWDEQILSSVDGTDYHLNGMARLDTGPLFIAAEAGHGYLSLDEGESWEELTLPYPGSMFGVIAHPRYGLFAYGLRGHVLQSADGILWQTLETDSINSLFGGTILDDGTLVLVGANGEMLVRSGRVFSSESFADRADLAAVVAIDGALIVVGETGITTLSSAAEDS